MRKLGLLLLSVVVLAGVIVGFRHSVSALTDTSTNETESPAVWHVIAWHQSNEGYSMRLGAYYDTWPSGGTISIQRAPDGGPTPGGGIFTPACNDLGDAFPASTNFGRVTMESMPNGSTRTYSVNRANFCASPAHNNGSFFGTFDLPTTAPDIDPETGKYKMVITVSIHEDLLPLTNKVTQSPQAYFRVTAPGALVGPMAGQDIGTRSYQNQGYRAHRLYFGSDCSITSNTWRTVTLTDPDNYMAPGVVSYTQGNGDTPTDPGRELIFHVAKRPAGSTGSYTYLTASEYQLVSSGYVQADDSAGYRRWIPTGIHDINNVSPDSRINIRMEPNMAYRLFVSQVNWKNILQVQLPTDSIFHDVECDSGDGDISIQPSAEINPRPYALVGDTLNADFLIRNLGTNTGTDTSVNYEARVYVDNDGNGSWSSGDVSKYTQTQTVVIPGGGQNEPASWTAPASLVDFPTTGRVCATLTILSTSRGEANPVSETSCTSIGKVPKVHILNGDITVGGSTIEADPMCLVDSAQAILQGTTDASGYSFSEYGIIGNGPVDNFGSNNTRFNLTLGLAATFANTPTVGNFNGGGQISNCMNSPFDHFADAIALSPASLPAGWSYLAGGSGTYSINSPLNLGSNQRRIYDLGNSDLVINRNISYPNSYTSFSQLSQFAVLTNGFIYIDEGVTRLDGVYAANDGIHDCSQGRNINRGVGISSCNQQLVVNGSIYVGPEASIQVWRTFGADSSTSTDPAEIFRLSPNTIMAEALYSDDGEVETTSLEELPARF